MTTKFRSKPEELMAIKDCIRKIKYFNEYDKIEIAMRLINESRFLTSAEKDIYRSELDEYIKFNRETINRRMIEESEKKQKEWDDWKKKRAVFSDAKERYKSLSVFKKIKYFRQRPSAIKSEDLSIQELNNLYRRR